MGFARRPPSPPHGGGANADLDADFLLYVSEILHESAPAISAASPAVNAAPSSVSTTIPTTNAIASSSGSSSSLDSHGSSSHGGLKEATNAKLERQRALAVKRRRAYRERSTSELQSLRQQAAALSAQLEALTNQKAAGVTGVAASSSTTLAVSNAPGSSRDSVWRELAFRQREGRLAAERLRKRLKTQVASRQAFIRDIASSLCQSTVPSSSSDVHNAVSERLASCRGSESRLALSTGAVGALLPPPHESLSRIELADSSLFETYLSELDAAYEQTDEVLRESGLSSLPDETRHQRISRKESKGNDDDDDDGYNEIVDSLVVPFRFESVRAILWDAVVRVHARVGRQTYESVRDPSNTIAVKFTLQCRPRDGAYEGAGSVPLVIILVLRRYVERAREVLVWRAFSEGMGSVAGLSSDETGWSVTREASMPADSPFGTDATINQTVVRFHTIRVHPMGSSSSNRAASMATTPPDERLFAQLIASSADEDGEQISLLMERLMLGEEGERLEGQSG